MLKIAFQQLFYLILWILSSYNGIWAAPQGGPSLDLGIYKISVDTDNGLAVRRDINIDLPFFKVKKTTEIGFGNPMVRNSDDDSDSDSDEMRKRRKKREILTAETANENGTALEHIRKKREPCYTHRRPVQPQQPQQPDTGGGDEVIEDEARRRRSAMSKRNSARKNRSQSRKRQKGRRRRRRQIAMEDFGAGTPIQKDGNKFSQSIDYALQKVNSVWNSFLQTTEKLMQDVKETINSWRSGKKEIPKDFEQPKDTEYIK